MNLDESKIVVLYIVGYGHSGSTFLDTVLGNYEGIEGVGELCNLYGYAWQDGYLCACGEKANKCKFWSDIRQEWVRQCRVDDIDGYLEAQQTYDNWKSPECWYRLINEKKRPSNRFRIYSELTTALFEAITQISGNPVIVDSSKSPTRAMALSMMNGIDLRLIHLVRDGRGIIWSLLKRAARVEQDSVPTYKKWKIVLRAALAWTIVNRQADILRKGLGPEKAIFVRYEDFSNHPVKILNKMGALIGVDLTPLGYELENGKSMKIGHTIAGNRLRMKRSVKLKPDFEWKRNLPKEYENIFEILGGWLLHRYGY